MIVNGLKIPHVEVDYEFARNPLRYSYSATERIKGGIRIRSKRPESDVIPIPVIYFRRDTNKLWDDIIEELTGILYSEKDSLVSFSHGDSSKYYLGQIMAITIEEEHEKGAKGYIELVCEDQRMFGKTKSINLTTSNQTFLITGQTSTPWTSRTVFTQSASQFTIVGPYDGNITLNYDFIAGDVLEIDYKKRDVYLNGNDLAVAVDLRTNWFELPVGNITLQASHGTEITYTERYY